MCLRTTISPARNAASRTLASLSFKPGRDVFIFQTIQPLQRPKRVNLRQRSVICRRDQFFEQLPRRFFRPLDDYLLSGVAPPAVRIRKFLHQLRSGSLREFRPFRRGPAVVRDLPNATAMAVVSVEMPLLHLIGEIGDHVGLVLQDAVVKIDNVERTVRAVVKAYGTEPFIGAGQKIDAIVLHALSGRGEATFVDDLA